MDDYAGRVLADRYRLPLPPSDAYELVETRAFDTYSGQEVLLRQVPLPEVVDAEVVDAEGAVPPTLRATGRGVRRPTDPAVRRAIEAAQAAAQVPDHPRLDQVFDVFAEAGSLWIASELVAARPLAALLAERPLNPYRAAEIGSDVLTALRVLHAHGWTHRNITVRTVLVCDDGRVVLTGLAAGAAEEALCGYVPVPRPDDDGGYGPPAVESGPTGPYEAPPPPAPSSPPSLPPLPVPSLPPAPDAVPERDNPGVPPPVEAAAPRGHLEIEAAPPAADRAEPELPVLPGSVPGPARTPVPGSESGAGTPPPAADRAEPEPQGLVPRPVYPAVPVSEPGAGSAAQLRAARAGAIAAYRAGARAAARAGADDRDDQHRDDRHTDEPQADGTAEHGVTGGAPGIGAGPGAGPGTSPATSPAAGRDAFTGPETVAAGPGTWPGDVPGPRPVTEGEEDTEPGAGPGVPAPPQFTGAWGRPGESPYHGPYGAEDPYDDEGDDEDDEGPDDTRLPGRVYLAGVWDDGPGGGRPVPAGGSAGGFGDDEWSDQGDDRGGRLPQPVGARVSAGGWDEVVAGGGGTADYRGPATPLAAERARQARIAVVGAVTERWAPEQAGPVHDNWQLAPPIGPSTDLWALGALLYRAVQGHAPYPEDNAAELVQMVCGEPPAFAEECGPLRPVVESLLRQDPTERPDIEELRGWLRSLVRSAPEPEAGADVVPLPPTDTTRLPVVRRRGELVRRRWGRRGAAQGRHRQAKRQSQEAPPPRYEKPPRAPREPKGPKVLRQPPPGREPGGRKLRRTGRLLLGLILLLMAGAVAYAVMFMPGADTGTGGGTGSQDRSPGSSASVAGESGASPSKGPSDEASPSEQGGTGSQQPQSSRSAAALAPGYALRKDAEGFEIGVPKDFQRSPANTERQVRYGSDGFTVLVVPGRDTVKANGGDPLDYQRSSEPELNAFRESSWASSSGVRRVDVGQKAMAEGQFTWLEGNGREVYVRNLVMIVSGRYHIVQVIGPEGERDKVSDIYEQAVATYRSGS
ncbi:serine/threonine protein kinase [Streptomyces sp. NBC_01754]|uniref:serine/threonine protein kinase n=1 Tax=Streptomyces sp. NBC_01754 TaxID=2975930 RepID=UPI002DDBC036|nr:serine/threonine protein kinase [Streptomyces sp. NBC_01754]WSC94379.1 serine/threonine protein kinase [Streptomyces sp. NBC_01754]